MVKLLLQFNNKWLSDTLVKADCSPVSSGVEAVGEEGALSFQPGGAAEVGRLSWLEVVEVSPATAAARQPLVSNLTRLPPLHTLRCRILQPGDTERLNKPRTSACFSRIRVLPWCWVLSRLKFQPSTKSGSGRSACPGRHALTWQRSSARTPQCFSSHPVCLSTGLFNTARHAGSVIRPCIPKPLPYGFLKPFDIQIHTHSETECEQGHSTTVFNILRCLVTEGEAGLILIHWVWFFVCYHWLFN